MNLAETEVVPQREVSHAGRYLVVGMFLMGFAATGLLFLYWHLHLMPFMPLQEAIVAEFKDSSPRVEGGRRKMHQDSPPLLRIVVRVPFDPSVADPQVHETLEHHMNRLRQLSAEHLPAEEYRILEVHFYHPVKEKDLREHLIRRDLQSWKNVDAEGHET